jgi:predicted nucleotidyltransferase
MVSVSIENILPFMTHSIRPDHLQMVQTILHNHVHSFEACAFGSRARGDAGKNSDLDLCLVGDKPLSFEARANLKLAFSESNIPYCVDLVEWATLSEGFRKLITQDKQVIHFH